MENNFQKLHSKLDAIEPLISLTRSEKIKALYVFLAERLNKPESYVTFLGETSSGKSTIINSLMGENILPTGASPTTGGISEITLTSNAKETEFYALNKNAAVERIDSKRCMQLIRQPTDDLERVRIVTHHTDERLQNMRIFDTPGYDSIVEQHEEILKEFLPNSDLVIYTVGYRIGIQESDFTFLRFLHELIRKDVEVILAINRCPENTKKNDRRVSEIIKYACDALGYTPEYFLINTAAANEHGNRTLPSADELWEYVGKTVNSEKRMDELYNAFDMYIKELFYSCSKIINQRYVEATVSREDAMEMINEQLRAGKRIREAVPLIIEPAFDKLTAAIPEKISQAANNAEKAVQTDVENTPTSNRDEMISYVNIHLMPYYIKRETDEVSRYIDVMMTDMNNRVDDYINAEIEQFNSNISVRVNSYTNAALLKAGSNTASRLAVHGLMKYFTQFGGAGGANAGIANAASHLLKKAGNIFGKTFSRETHNALKHTLAKIGATSMKTVGMAVTAITEIVIFAVKYATWKPNLIHQISKSCSQWEEKTCAEVLCELKKLKDQNIKTVNDIAEEIETSFTSEKDKISLSSEELHKQVVLCEEIKNKIGA